MSVPLPGMVYHSLSAILTLRHHLDRLWKPISFNKVFNLLLLFLWRIFLITNFLPCACVCGHVWARMRALVCVWCVCVCMCVWVWVCVGVCVYSCMCWLIYRWMIWHCKRLVLSCTLTVWAQHKSPLLLLTEKQSFTSLKTRSEKLNPWPLDLQSSELAS